jgi:hypothetical protein
VTTKAEIKEWLERGKAKGAAHMLVVCDTYDWDDYPVYVMPEQNARAMADSYPKDMQKLMEVYDLSRDLDGQLLQRRAMNFSDEAA